MTMPAARNLGIVSLTTLLISAHYGLGFVLGTAEKSFTGGPAGSLYAVAVGLGMIALSLFARFYWSRIDPLWTLLGDHYGQPVKIGIGLMSWASLIGIAAVQIISAAAIVGITGLPEVSTMLGITGLLCLLSLLPIERVSWLLRGLLLLNIVVLISALWQLDQGKAYGQAMLDFWPSISHGLSTEAIGIALSTVLLVLIDMKCQQFVVRSQSLALARWSCILSGLILVALAFLPAAVVMAAQQAEVAPTEVAGKAIIPYVLSWFGGGAHKPLGIVYVSSLALPALGLGSNILRIQNKASLDIAKLNDTYQNQIGFSCLNAFLALGIALKGGEIVGLIIDFYAAYLSAVWVPFVAYLLEQAKIITFSIASVRLALIVGGAAALMALGMSLFYPNAVWFNSSELTILSMGLGFSSVALISAQAVGSLPFLLNRNQEEFEA